MSIPEGMNKGFLVESIPEGKLAISLILDRKEAGQIDGDGANAADLVVRLLTAAKATQLAAGLPLPEQINPANNPVVRPDLSASRVQILRNPGESKALMVLTFGQAQFSVSIPADFLGAGTPPPQIGKRH